MSSGVIGDLSLESMEDEEVATMDGVFEGAFGALSDKTWFGGGSFGGCHGGFWWLIMDEEDDEVVKLPILKKVKYPFGAMLDRHYLTNTDYSCGNILNGDGSIQVATDENGVETELPPKTAQALLARQRERRAKSILLLAIPGEYQLRFHAIKDAKTLWAAIKKGLDKAYDRFQKLISLLEVHALIMRNKDGIDDLDIDDLYNNLKVFEANIKGSSGSSSNSQNVAFLFAEDTSSSNEVNTANGVSTASGYNSPRISPTSSYTDDIIISFLC
ncbi:hypothetical protein Tco_0019262 [Tanacetum coccineum]